MGKNVKGFELGDRIVADVGMSVRRPNLSASVLRSWQTCLVRELLLLQTRRACAVRELPCAWCDNGRRFRRVHRLVRNACSVPIYLATAKLFSCAAHKISATRFTISPTKSRRSSSPQLARSTGWTSSTLLSALTCSSSGPDPQG